MDFEDWFDSLNEDQKCAVAHEFLLYTVGMCVPSGFAPEYAKDAPEEWKGLDFNHSEVYLHLLDTDYVHEGDCFECSGCGWWADDANYPEGWEDGGLCWHCLEDFEDGSL